MGRYLRCGLLCGLIALASCGGGGSSSPDNPPPPNSNINSTLTQATQVWSASQKQSIVSESPSQIVVAGSPTVKVGDVILTDNTALKVATVTAGTGGQIAVAGTTPELSEVFQTLQVASTDFNPTADQFVPATGVTVTNASSRPHALSMSKPLATTELSVTFSKEFATGLSGELKLSLTPIVNAQIDSVAKTGSASFSATVKVEPSITVSAALTDSVPFSLGYYNLPLPVPGVPPGTFGVRVPIKGALTITAGKIQAKFSAEAIGKIGAQTTFSSSGVSITPAVSNGLQCADNDAIASFDLGATASTSFKVSTGVVLTAFFGLAEPLSGLVSTGPVGTFTYAKVTLTSGAPFDINCMSSKVTWDSDLSAQLNFFGLKDAKTVIAESVKIGEKIPATSCVELLNTTTAMSTSPNPSQDGSSVTFSATIQAASSPQPFSGGVEFKDSLGSIACSATVSTVGTATCTAGVSGIGTKTFVAVYSGDSTFASSTSSPYSHTVGGLPADIRLAFQGVLIPTASLSTPPTPPFCATRSNEYDIHTGNYYSYSFCSEAWASYLTATCTGADCGDLGSKYIIRGDYVPGSCIFTKTVVDTISRDGTVTLRDYTTNDSGLGFFFTMVSRAQITGGLARITITGGTPPPGFAEQDSHVQVNCAIDLTLIDAGTSFPRRWFIMRFSVVGGY